MTTSMFKKTEEPEGLRELVAKAKAAFDALTPEEQRAHRRLQAISWVKGEALLSRAERGQPELSSEEVDQLEKDIADIYDRKRAEDP